EKERRPESRIWIAEDGADARQVTRGPSADLLPRFSPDGSRLAFASDRDHAGRWAPYLPDGAGEARPIGGLAGSGGGAIWAAGGGWGGRGVRGRTGGGGRARQTSGRRLRRRRTRSCAGRGRNGGACISWTPVAARRPR